jgi:hypothetical protein
MRECISDAKSLRFTVRAQTMGRDKVGKAWDLT